MTPALVTWLREIVADEAAKTTAPFVVVTSRPPPCFPHHFLVDQAKRKVTCAKCKREFPAFDALAHMVRGWETYQGNLSALQGDVRRLEIERKELERRVRNLRAVAQRAEVKKARPRPGPGVP